MFLGKLKKGANALLKGGNRGATIMEYTLIAAILIGLLIGAYKKLGVRYFKMYSHLSDNIP